MGDGERGGREEVGTQRSGYAHSYSCGSREDKDEAGRPVSIPIYVGWCVGELVTGIKMLASLVPVRNPTKQIKNEENKRSGHP